MMLQGDSCFLRRFDSMSLNPISKSECKFNRKIRLIIITFEKDKTKSHGENTQC